MNKYEYKFENIDYIQKIMANLINFHYDHKYNRFS
jgi:hypothetical protein